MSCGETDNLVCKHADATMTFYLNLDGRLPSSVTIVSASATVNGDETVEVDSISVLEEAVTNQEGTACTEVVLPPDRAVLIRLSGGTNTGDEITISIACTRSDGDIDVIDCRLIIT